MTLGMTLVVSGACMLIMGRLVTACICKHRYIREVQGHVPQVFFGKYVPMIAI